ncbi:CLUMA_CG008709, isoform A [Clunio marinus]|uniref:CLUMA_CG008709, isoform A n=1 Tax=Clunio marinus TaxID=568069 RepID=A0A1J1I4P7_9DIPT|nr:CLUMA_CG008709, isoform A [Clunio marinus]
MPLVDTKSGENKGIPKRIRTAFSNSQLLRMEEEFAIIQYLNRPKRIHLANVLHLTERQIKIW